MLYAKTWVAIAGATVTSCISLVSEDSTLWVVLTILSAALTAAGVYMVPNKPNPVV